MSNNGISGYSDTFMAVLMLIVGFRHLAGQTPLFQGILTPFWRCLWLGSGLRLIAYSPTPIPTLFSGNKKGRKLRPFHVAIRLHKNLHKHL